MAYSPGASRLLRSRRTPLTCWRRVLRLSTWWRPSLAAVKSAPTAAPAWGKTVHHSGAHPQHRYGPLRLLRVRGRGRAVQRGQRPLARDAGLRCYEEHGAGFRPDERASWRAAPNSAHRADYGRVLPGPRRPGRFSCSSTTSTGTSWLAWKCPLSWAECPRRWDTSPR